ncbi:MAG: ATP-binding protein [Acidobacteriota bacterium]
MLDSLRARLLAWYSLILVLVIGTFGATVCYLYWRSLVREIDLDLARRAAAVAAAVRPAPGGTFDLELPAGVAREFGGPNAPAPYFAIWTAEGELAASTESDPGDPPAARPATRSREGRREAILAAPGGALVLVGRDAADVRREVWSLAGTVGGVGVAALGLSLLGGWFLAGRALAPVSRISRTAAAMSAGDLGARIPLDRTESELEQVAVSLNAAFDRLDDALRKERQFTADASHELRTPLAALWTEIEWALARPRTGGEYRQSLETCLAAGARMRGVVEGLLTLAHADAGTISPMRIPVGLKTVAEEAVVLLRPVAERRAIAVTVRGDDVVVDGDPDRLREMITNLVSNAIDYNVDGGAVNVIVSGAGGVRLTVSDTGVGIAEADLPRVFDRFYRADPARARNAGGAGLGLAVAKWVAESHGGTIACKSVPGQGTTIEVIL